jgi:ribose-phosphate pyrophosphokinase
VLIVDDICSRGGTFVHTAKALKDAGAANVYLYITHCERTIFNGEIFSSGLIEKVFTTNSIFPANSTSENIEIVE